jgi:tRNA nucleotidyltransferase/poly(A) polymerase
MMKLEPQAFMMAAPTQKLMAALGEARFVGGAVRNALMKRAISDIDIATPLRPEAVTERLHSAAIKVVPTGIEHGTVTAVVDGKPFEVTTLRRDVATDGRRAQVVFTTDWAEDATRRDFTMNALYADSTGTIYDYVGGVDDCFAGRVRFVGDPVLRIREDYLRILRFFRFHAWYGRTQLDAGALYACEKEKAGLAKLSGERIAKEMLKLVEAANPVAVLMTMAVVGILPDLIPGAGDVLRLRRLAAIDTERGTPPDALLRLATLLPRERALLVAQLVASRWKLSNAQKDRLIAAASAPRDLLEFADLRMARRQLYRMGAARFADAMLLALVEETRETATWRAVLEHAKDLAVPDFPLSGKDVLERGVRIGPLVGKILQDIESWWIEADFPMDMAALYARLDEAVEQVKQ